MRDDTHRFETVWVPLTRVRIRERRLRGLSASTVERYRVWLEQGREAPPVRLARDGEWFLVRDGRHRVAAALAAGLTVIEAEVRRMWAAVVALRPGRRPLTWRALPRGTCGSPDPSAGPLRGHAISCLPS